MLREGKAVRGGELMRGRVRMAAIAIALAALAFVMGLSRAEEPPARLRGVIESVEGEQVRLQTRTGDHVIVRLPQGGKVVAITASSIADIHPGDFVGATAIPHKDGALRAVEVHIFPEAMRGTGEGHRLWDVSPTSTMTNGTVGQTVTKVEGNVLTITYKDGEKAILVTPETSIVRYLPADRGELKPGAKVFVSAAKKQPDGTFQAERINVGRNGLTPPM